MGDYIVVALGLMLVLEGVLPLILPQVWRETFIRMLALRDGQLRFVGLVSIVAGLLLIFLSK